MKKYFNVSFQYSESVYSEATAADVEEAQRKGKPIVEIETPAAEADTVRQAALIQVLRNRRDWLKEELARALDKTKEYEAAAWKARQDAREALADAEAERDDLAQRVENAMQHAEDMEAEAEKLAAEVLRLKARLFDLMEAQQGRTA